MEAFRFRPARPEDLDDILAVEDDSFDPAVRENRETFRERLEVFPAGFVVLEGPDGVAGYLCSELWSPDGDPEPADFALGHSARERHRPEGRSLYVSSYGIRRTLRGRGLGKLFFRDFLHLAERSLSFDEVLLLVSGTWTGARAIYESEGFRPVLTVPGFFRFSDGVAADGIVLRRYRVRGSTGAASTPMMVDKELP